MAMSSPLGLLSRTRDDDVEKGIEDTESSTNTFIRHGKIEVIRRGTHLSMRSRYAGSNPGARSVPQPRKRRDIVVRNGHDFKLDEEAIFEVFQYYNEYSSGATTLRGLEKFDDCSDYGLPEEDHQKMVRTEIKRLMEVAASNDPFLFNSNGHLSLSDEQGYQDVSNLMDQIRCNFNIIRHDNARLCVEHCPEKMERAIDEFKITRFRLITRYKQDADRVQGCIPKLLEPPKKNQELYFALVDYLLGSISRLLVRTASSKYWQEYTLAILAQWVVKLKVVSYDPVRCAATSLSNGEDVIDQVTGSMNNKRLLMLKVKLGPDKEEKEFDTLDTETDIKGQYYDENSLFRLHLYRLLKFASNSMYVGYQSGKKKELGPYCFEACTLVYKTGLDGVPTALSNDRFGDVTASSESTHINCLYGGLDLLLQNIEAIKARSQENSHILNTISQDIGATVKWEWFEGGARTRKFNGNLTLANMDDILSLTIPLGLASTYTAMQLDNTICLASTGTSSEDPVMQFEPPQRGFKAFFNIGSAEFYLRQRKAASDRYHDPEICSVSASPLKRGIRAGTDLMLQSQKVLQRETPSKSDEIIAEYAKHKQEMDHWVVSEDSITIKCRWYVALVITTALIVVCGCMAVPFLVRTRIQGVDPFQITTFGWGLAFFVVILAKSRYVSEWPWHQFLRGQVVCRSISDVNEVTKIDPQMILMNLLHNERDNILKTRGPFNGMFGRQAEGPDGFSIDVSVKLSTMLASGFIMLKVINEKGEHLICEDVRKGASGISVTRNEPDTFLMVKDVGKDALNEGGDEETEKSDIEQAKSRRPPNEEKVLKLRVVENFRWVKVLGLYIRDSKFG